MVTDHSGMALLSRSACYDLLRRQTVGRLAVVDHGRAEIFPVNFVVDGDRIVFRTAAGTKLDAVVNAPEVVFEVDDLDEAAGEAWSVIARGRAREIDGMYELVDALALPLFPWHAAPKHRFVGIEPRELSGRRFHVVQSSAWGEPARTG